MKIFLTGATGFLGKSLVDFLPHYEFFTYKRGSDIINDLRGFNPDYIIHSAGEIYKEKEMLTSNLDLTKSVLDYVKDHNIKKMIYFGSSSEYGISSKLMSETDACKPVTLYATTKLVGSLLCQSYATSYDKDICVVRPFSVYGINEPEHRLIPTLKRSALNGDPIKIIKGNHDFIYIKDFVDLVETVLQSETQKTKGDIINAGSGQQYSNLEVVQMFEQILSRKLKYQEINEFKACDSKTWLCDTSHASEKYGFKCKYTFETGLKEYILY